MVMFFFEASSPSQNSSSPQSIPSPQRRPIFTQESYWNQSITLRSILNSVILDEWLKELAAICEEQALRLSVENYEDDTYIRAVALWLRARAANGFKKNDQTVHGRLVDTSLWLYWSFCLVDFCIAVATFFSWDSTDLIND